MNDDLHLLNVLYIEMIRMLPYEVLISEFRLSVEVIRTIKDLHVDNLYKLTDCAQLLLKPNEAVLCQALEALHQK
ncbi:hypothetical protein HmCmsJML185_01352 [Escherichia coli]|nr:hypothetical protein HmCmsJML185_01352 [Escherichia coli]